MHERPPFSTAFAEALEAVKPGWRLDGPGLVGPGSARLRFADRHPSEQGGHVDVAFEFSPKLALWDCVTGHGASPREIAATAAHAWVATTGSALLELMYSGRGEFATHVHGHEPGGFPGWHAIHGNILAFGGAQSRDRLQQWWLDHPLLPDLARAMSASLAADQAPYGVKILFGGSDVAEVRLDGEAHEPASRLLLGIDWPRLEPSAFARSYVLLVHPESAPRGL